MRFKNDMDWNEVDCNSELIYDKKSAVVEVGVSLVFTPEELDKLFAIAIFENYPYFDDFVNYVVKDEIGRNKEIINEMFKGRELIQESKRDK